jgi:ribosomal protein L3 glutamine methyltransferase
MPRNDTTAALTTVRDWVRWGASEFARAGLHFGHGTDNALDEAFHLVLHALALPPDLPAVYLEATLTGRERTRVQQLLARRIRTRKPAAYLTGEIHFCGLPFHVDERVLVPRSPIGEMIERGFQPWVQQPPGRILDLCAGSGCIGIACAMRFPDSTVDLAEVDAGALTVSRRNIERHHCADRVRALRSDVFSGVQGQRYDLIVANPPYVPLAEWKALPEEFHQEPRKALAAGADGMDVVARILADAASHLNEGGVLVCEVGGSTEEFEARWPRLPVAWVEFENGGDGVFVIDRAQLVRAGT